MRLATRYLDEEARDLDDALARIARATAERKAVSVGLVFWWAMQRFARLNRKNVDEERDSIATRDLLLSQLRALGLDWADR